MDTVYNMSVEKGRSVLPQSKQERAGRLEQESLLNSSPPSELGYHGNAVPSGTTNHVKEPSELLYNGSIPSESNHLFDNDFLPECDAKLVAHSPSEMVTKSTPTQSNLLFDNDFPPECDAELVAQSPQELVNNSILTPSSLLLHSDFPPECDAKLVAQSPPELVTNSIPLEIDVVVKPSQLVHHSLLPESNVLVKTLEQGESNSATNLEPDDKDRSAAPEASPNAFISEFNTTELTFEFFKCSPPLGEGDTSPQALPPLSFTNIITTSENNANVGQSSVDPFNISLPYFATEVATSPLDSVAITAKSESINTVRTSPVDPFVTKSESVTKVDKLPIDKLTKISKSESETKFGILPSVSFTNIANSESSITIHTSPRESTKSEDTTKVGSSSLNAFVNPTKSEADTSISTLPFSNIASLEYDKNTGPLPLDTISNTAIHEVSSEFATLPIETLYTARQEDTKSASKTNELYVLAVDIGTSTIRGHVYDNQAHIRGMASKQQHILQPEPGWSEIDPKKLLDDVCSVAKESISASGLRPNQITCMGITTLRASFLTWDRETGEPFHNLITWQDLRAVSYVSEWNRSYALRVLNTGAKILYKLFRKKRHLAGSVLKFMSKQVTMRLLWVFNNIPEVRKRASARQVMFGCTESWLLWKLTREKKHVTDFSCASATGLFDPFQMEWSTIVCGLLNIPMNIFPEIKDTSGDFGTTDPDRFGFEVPITAVVADQQGSMFGQCCFSPGDVKCTMGTGTFLDLNTGRVPHASVGGLYPIIGWKIGRELVFLAEGHCADTGIVVEWARTLGLLDDVADSSSIAESVPAFSGLQAPFNDDTAATAMFGMMPSTTKAHMVRAVLESLVFRFKSLYEVALHETRIPFSRIRVDGGVAGNNFLVQMISDLVDQEIEQSLHGDMSCLGAAFLAGLAKGVWSSKEELKLLREKNRLFQPRKQNKQQMKLSYQHWENAVQRSKNWYFSSVS